MTEIGFMIPLDQNDYLSFSSNVGKPQGDRTNWCSAPPPQIKRPGRAPRTAGGPWKNLPLQPATSPPRGLGLRKNGHKCEGYLGQIICEVEDCIEDVVELVEGRPDGDRRGRRITLRLPPGGIATLLMQAEVDASEPPGTVHVFDIVQTDPSGRRGGIRVGAIVVP